MAEALPSSARLLADLVALPGPPGQEAAVRDYLAACLTRLGIVSRVDAKGNLLAAVGDVLPERPSTVVIAHMDEIALMVSSAGYGNTVRVAPLGGVHPWKWGEGPVHLLPVDGGEPIVGVLSFGSIHTTSPLSLAQSARDGKAVGWGDAFVVTGYNTVQLESRSIVPGSRVVIAPERRTVLPLGQGLVGSYFLDDRADCVAWLLALAALKESGEGKDILFIASASEEVGGEGALFALSSLPEPPAVCVALEIGPVTPDAPLELTDTPTLWVTDSFATMQAVDIHAVRTVARDAGTGVQLQTVTRGGSDATCAASHGLCARPVTLAFAAENSHGFEIMHQDAPESLARLLVAYLRTL